MPCKHLTHIQAKSKDFWTQPLFCFLLKRAGSWLWVPHDSAEVLVYRWVFNDADRMKKCNTCLKRKEVARFLKFLCVAALGQRCYLLLYPQGLEQSRCSNKCKINEWNKLCILLDVPMASGLLRHDLYSNTSFMKSFTVSGCVESSTFLVTLELESLWSGQQQGASGKSTEARTPRCESWSITCVLCALEFFTSEIVFCL